MATRLLATFFLALITAAAAPAQTRPEFEVASVRPSGEQPLDQVAVGVQISGSQVRITAMTLRDYLVAAYRLKPFQVAGPDRLSQARFDVAAKIPDGGDPEQVPEMLQSLLAARFGLEAHREMRELPVYALVVADGGPTLTESPPDPAGAARGPVQVAASGSAAGVAIDLGGGSSFRLADSRVEIRRMTMTEAAEMLERFLDRPVVDATGLTARYDVTLDLAPEEYVSMLVRSAVNQGMALPPQALRLLDGASRDPLSGPLQPFGLRLDARRQAMDVLVVDAMLEAPTPN